MRISLLAIMAVAAGFLTGCAGPERKLGRGVSNLMEFTRGGDMRRSMEQTALWDGTDEAYTAGAIRGFNKTVKRTAIGVAEIVTFPFPSYDPYTSDTASTAYPDSYRPNLIADPVFGPDAALGFSGGDIAPMLPGSRFRIFDY